MDIRKANIIVGKSGGNAKGESKTFKLSLPTAWMRELGIDDDSRQVELSFDGEKIVLQKALTLDEFAKARISLGHEVWLLKYYNGEILCTEICSDFSEKSVRVKNHTDQMIKTAFGKNETPSWDEFVAFLEERCVPRGREGIREYLETIGVDEYDPFEIIKKTAGRMAEDDQWIELERMK